MLVREPLDLMPKKTVARIMPHPDKMAQFRRLGWFGRKLFASDLWHLNRRTVALAFLNGIFWACMPIPMQMLAAALTALVIRCNVPISVGLVFITNPVTMPPYYLAAYQLGAWVLQSDPIALPDAFTMHWLMQQLNLIWLPLLVGCLIFGLILSIVGYFAVRIWWVIQVRLMWQVRQKRIKLNEASRAAAATVDPPSPPLGDHGSRSID